MFSEFFERITSTFKHSFDLPEGGRALPAARDPTADDINLFRALGRLLCNLVIRKCVIEAAKYDIFSCSLSSFLFAFLCYEEDAVFSDVDTALCALHKFDPLLRVEWSKLLEMDEQQLQEHDLLTSAFAEDGADGQPVTTANISDTLIDWCRFKLLTSRLAQMSIMRDAFFFSNDPKAETASRLMKASVRLYGGYALSKFLTNHSEATQAVVISSLKLVGSAEAEGVFELLKGFIGNLKQEDIKRFLKFVTGRNNISDQDRIIVERMDGASWGAFPSSSTCEKKLCIPLDLNAQQLHDRMHHSILASEADGFHRQ